jgi:hypothetical protein
VRLVYAGRLKRDSDVLMSRQARIAAKQTMDEEDRETILETKETETIGFVAACDRKVSDRLQVNQLTTSCDLSKTKILLR